MKRRTTVLLADDHAIVAEGLATLLKDHFDLLETVGDGSALIDAARKLRPDVIVTDIAMPVLSGLEALRRLKPYVVAILEYTPTDSHLFNDSPPWPKTRSGRSKRHDQKGA